MLTVKNIYSSILFLVLVLFARTSIAKEPAAVPQQQELFLLQQMAKAPSLDGAQKKWLELFEQPGNSQHYFLTNKQGQIFQLEQDNPNSTRLLVDLKQLAANAPEFQLSALSLHPNFSQQGQIGFNTFYTAHIESHANERQSHRIFDANVNKALPFDAVVTEWKLSHNSQVNNTNRREIIRIAVPTAESAINQLSFNPYSKSWHEDFAQLYLSLPESPELKQRPLYSGAILRVHPEQTATASYSTPYNNPYYANPQYEKTLYVFGIGNIKQFLWPEKHSTRLLISHRYSVNNSSKHWLSYSDGGDNWQQSPPKEFIYQTTETISANNLLVYRGQNVPLLRNKLLLLTNQDQAWQISSLRLETSIDATSKPDHEGASKSTLEWLLQHQSLTTKELTLHRDNRGELLLFNEDDGTIFQVFQQDKDQVLASAPSSSSSMMNFLLIVILVLLLAYALYRSKIYQNSAKAFVRREFSALAVTSDMSGLNFFKRHQHEVDKSILLSDIKQCQFMLGNLVVMTINSTHRYGFSNLHEQELREIFHTEHIDKMVDGKIRRINVLINTYQKNNYIVCLYLRKGSDRITKKSYFDVVDDVIDWCWLISGKINPQHTEMRCIQTENVITDLGNADHKMHDDTPLHRQAAIIRPATHNQEQSQEKSKVEPSADELIREQTKLTSEDRSIVTAKAETDLVNAIEKLVKLQQQGFLSTEEFEQAKAKLLASLSNTE